MSTDTITRLIRRDLLAVQGYAAPASLEELQARFGSRLVKLDQNENPYGCSPRVREALARYDGYHAYPDVLAREVRGLLADDTGVPAERIVIGNGADEIIELTLRLLIEPGDRVINCPPTFGYYQFAASIAGAVTVPVNRRPDFSPDVAAIRAACAAPDGPGPRPKIVFLASPNNPTGNLVDPDDVCRLLDTGLLVVVDEAYVEFAGRSLISLTLEHENLVIMRTFSKWAGLAGLRAGYGVFPAALVPHLIKIKPSFNVNVAAQVAMKASLLDLPYLSDLIRRLIAERERLYRDLAQLAFLRPFPSQANFVFCHVLRGDAGEIKQQLEQEGILVRVYADPLLRNALRFSVGTPQQTDILIERLRTIGRTLA